MICRLCNIEKDSSCYRRRSRRCIDCENLKKREKYQENRESELKRVKEYQQTSEKRKTWHREYREINKEQIKENNNSYKRRRRETDPLFRIKNNLSVSIRRAFKKLNYSKNTQVYDAIGCSSEDFKSYLESRFESWMSWDNHGLYNGQFNYGWDLDHIIPLSTAKTVDEIVKLNHYTNLQPLCSKINREVKRNFL
jgi:hypothetical protein